MFFVFLVVPVYLIPFLEERFERRLPTRAPALSDHVLFYRFGPAVAATLSELEERGIESVVVEEDETVARRLLEHGHRVVFGELDDGVLDRAHFQTARAIVANGSDDQNASLTVTVRQAGFTGTVIAMAENPLHRRPLNLAGANVVFTPRHALGAALAAQASRRISPAVGGLTLLGDRLRVEEFRVRPSSTLAGLTLGAAAIGERTGAAVLGQWAGGRLHTLPTADLVIESQAVLVVAGSERALAELETLCEGTVSMAGRDSYVVCGAGEVGRKVAQLLRDADETCVVIDRTPGPGVDLVGDALDPPVLERAGVKNARAVIVALDTDPAALFATVIVRDLAPEAPILVRVNDADNLNKLYRSGADFALALSRVSAQILSRHILDEESVAVDGRLRLVRLEAPGLAGQTPREARLREATGGSVVAVEREGHLEVPIGADFRFAAADRVFLCAGIEAAAKFRHLYGGS